MDQTLLSCLFPFTAWRWLLSVGQILAEVAAKAAIGYIARGSLLAAQPSTGLLSLRGPPDLPYPSAVGASQVEPGWRSGMSCFSCKWSQVFGEGMEAADRG